MAKKKFSVVAEEWEFEDLVNRAAKNKSNLSSYCRDYLFDRVERINKEKRASQESQNMADGIEMQSNLTLNNIVEHKYEDFKEAMLERIDSSINLNENGPRLHEAKRIFKILDQINRKVTFKHLVVVISVGVFVGVLMGSLCYGILYFEKKDEVRRITFEKSKWNLIADDFNTLIARDIYPGIDNNLKNKIDAFYKQIEHPNPKEQFDGKRE